MGERRLCKPEVIGSNPFASTRNGGAWVLADPRRGVWMRLLD